MEIMNITSKVGECMTIEEVLSNEERQIFDRKSINIEPSMAVRANQADEAFLRVGDKSKKLSFEERTQLMYDKGERYFEDKAVPDATVEDLDMGLVKSYIDKIGYGKSELEYLKENKGFLKVKQGKELVSGAAILLFGKKPQLFFPRARIRFIRYEGNEEKSQNCGIS